METIAASTAAKGVEAKKKGSRLLLKMLAGQKRYLVLAAIFLMIAVAAAYITPMVTSYTIDSVIDSKPSTLPSFMNEFIESIGGRDYLRSNIYWLALALVAFTALNGLATYFRRRFVAEGSEGVAENFRNALYRHINAVPYDYHKHVSTGDLVQRCSSDVDTIRRFISVQLLEIVRTVAMVGFACAIMFSIDTRMALISMALLPILFAISFVYFKYVKKYFKLSDEAEGVLSATIQENLTGVRVVRAFGQQRDEMDKFTRSNDDFRKKTLKLIELLGMYWGGTDCLGYFQIALTLIVGIIYCVEGTFTLGNLVVFTTYCAMITWPVRQLGRVLADLGRSTVSFGRLREILDAPAEAEPGKALSPEIKGDIAFKNVCFGYDTPDDVLKNISFTAKPGETIAILGSTGSGKTSLVQLLQRLYTVTKGEITVDGVNINDICHEHLRSNIGIVLQEPFLYSRSIKENIRIVKPDASDEDIFEASRTAAIHDVVSGFENGYDTIVGERGVTLSGGQKQRVAIARMLMQRAPILIFDDSLSAVDTETDAAIREALAKRKEHCTTFIISHRITTLSKADKILVLEHGELVEEGTHHELVNKDGLYRRIAEIQNALEDELRQDEL